MASSASRSSTTTELTQSFEHNSYILRWTSLGPAEGQPLIFVHGTPWSSRIWAPFGEATAALGYHVYLFDNPGYGESHSRTSAAEKAEPQVSLADQAAAFADSASLYTTTARKPEPQTCGW